MKKILFIGDDLFNCGLEKLNTATLEFDLDGNECLPAWAEESEMVRKLEETTAGVWFISEECSQIKKLAIAGKVCRTYQEFLDELSNIEAYDHVVIDLSFPAGSEEAEAELADFIRNSNLNALIDIGARICGKKFDGWNHETVFANEYYRTNSCGPLVAKKLTDIGKSFTIFTRDISHAVLNFILLANMFEGEDLEELVNFINQYDKVESFPSIGKKILEFSSAKKIAAGTKHHLETWERFLEVIN